MQVKQRRIIASYYYDGDEAMKKIHGLTDSELNYSSIKLTCMSLLRRHAVNRTIIYVCDNGAVFIMRFVLYSHFIFAIGVPVYDLKNTPIEKLLSIENLLKFVANGEGDVHEVSALADLYLEMV